MKSYLEFVYLFHVIVCICASLLSGYILNQYIDKKKMFLVIIISNIVLVFFYSCLSVYFVLVIEIISIMLYIRKISHLFCQFMIRFIVIYLMYVLFDGTIYFGIWYMKTTSYQWILIALVLSIFTYVLLYRFSAFRKLHEYCYSVTIAFDSYCIRCYGYLDSGNFANYKNLPVIFLHHDDVLKVINHEIAYVQNKEVFVCIGTIMGIHIPKQKVYITYLDHEILNLYSCLLNQLIER